MDDQRKQKDPRHWKSKENIRLCLMIHESLNGETDFDLNEEIDQETIMDFYRHWRTRDGNCYGLWYTTDVNGCVVRIGITQNMKTAMSKFEKWTNEHKIRIYAGPEYDPESELKDIKQNFKRICEHNAIHGKGYRILNENIC